MQKQQLIWNAEPAVEIEIQQSPQAQTIIHVTGAPSRHRRMSVALTALPRRQSCVTRPAMLAALREAELAEWQSSGGDYLGAVA